MKIIRQAFSEEVVSYSKTYGAANGEVYFGFPCNEAGEVQADLNPAAAENYKACESGTLVKNKELMVFLEVRKDTHTVKNEAIGRCDDCDAKVHLTDPMTNVCNCGALYNSSGQKLKPESEWEEPWDEN